MTRTAVPLRRGLTGLALLLLAACSDVTLPGDRVPPLAPHADQALFREAARAAWSYADREYQPQTGLVNSVAGYEYATAWDIASGLAALYCANRLGLLPDAEYDPRMRRLLLTLQTAPLFEGAAFHKNYSTATGRVAGRDDRDTTVSEAGQGWSATDIGRLLTWLRIVAVNHPQYAEEVRKVVARIDFPRIVHGGYLHGTQREASGAVRSYPEGRIGYEQYAAAGYALWGHRAEPALRLEENTFPITVLDVPLRADRRGHDFLTSEPFILHGLELGWPTATRELALRVLQVQEERHRRTGVVTVVSEDHVPVAPYYFYYYSINHHGRQFTINVQDTDVDLDWPRWTSAKAAYAWHALAPNSYTRLAVDWVAPARSAERGWGSGVYEASREPTGSENVNTAAVILEAALFATTGRALIYGG